MPAGVSFATRDEEARFLASAAKKAEQAADKVEPARFGQHAANLDMHTYVQCS